MSRRSILRSVGGTSALEFAIAAPVLLSVVIGITEVGRLYYAHADLRNAVAAGARKAAIYPTPSDTDISDAITSHLAGLERSRVVGPELVHGRAANGYAYLDIRVRYSANVNLIFVSTASVPMEEKRRVYVQEKIDDLTGS